MWGNSPAFVVARILNLCEMDYAIIVMKNTELAVEITKVTLIVKIVVKGRRCNHVPRCHMPNL